MDETFTKLFGSILDSTVWAEDAETKVIWVTMLAMADQDGYVGASVPGLATRAGVSIQKVEEALAKFMAPDPYSRSRENEGRRIREVDRGWLLLNYRKFRDMRRSQDRRMQLRAAQQRYRERKRGDA